MCLQKYYVPSSVYSGHGDEAAAAQAVLESILSAISRESHAADHSGAGAMQAAPGSADAHPAAAADSGAAATPAPHAAPASPAAHAACAEADGGAEQHTIAPPQPRPPTQQPASPLHSDKRQREPMSDSATLDVWSPSKQPWHAPAAPNAATAAPIAHGSHPHDQLHASAPAARDLSMRAQASVGALRAPAAPWDVYGMGAMQMPGAGAPWHAYRYANLGALPEASAADSAMFTTAPPWL
jgi:hypothetical protein